MILLFFSLFFSAYDLLIILFRQLKVVWSKYNFNIESDNKMR